MKCPKCNSEMLLLLTSYICETCEAPSIQTPSTIPTGMEYTCDFTAAAPIGKSKRVSGTQVGPPLSAIRDAYEKICGVGFYYDPEYARKNNCQGADFQIGSPDSGSMVSRYVFTKKEIRKLLEWMHLIPTTFSASIGGTHFEYDDKIHIFRIAGYTFTKLDIDKIYHFFQPLVLQAP